jgi:hypothetical protein
MVSMAGDVNAGAQPDEITPAMIRAGVACLSTFDYRVDSSAGLVAEAAARARQARTEKPVSV